MGKQQQKGKQHTLLRIAEFPRAPPQPHHLYSAVAQQAATSKLEIFFAKAPGRERTAVVIPASAS